MEGNWPYGASDVRRNQVRERDSSNRLKGKPKFALSVVYFAASQRRNAVTFWRLDTNSLVRTLTTTGKNTSTLQLHSSDIQSCFSFYST